MIQLLYCSVFQLFLHSLKLNSKVVFYSFFFLLKIRLILFFQNIFFFCKLKTIIGNFLLKIEDILTILVKIDIQIVDLVLILGNLFFIGINSF